MSWKLCLDHSELLCEMNVARLHLASIHLTDDDDPRLMLHVALLIWLLLNSVV